MPADAHGCGDLGRGCFLGGTLKYVKNKPESLFQLPVAFATCPSARMMLGKKMRPAVHAAPAEGDPVGVLPLRILIADDERDAVLTLTTLLRDEGYDVRGVYDGAQALEAARDFLPNVALLDIGMPKLNGYDVARALRKRYGEDGMVLIAVTAYHSGADRVLAKIAGFDHHFGKPYDPQALAGLLSSLTPKSS